MEIHAVVADVDAKEHFIETYSNVEEYEKAKKKRLKEESSLEFVGRFTDCKRAVREARIMSKPSYAKGWSYNKSRNIIIGLMEESI